MKRFLFDRISRRWRHPAGNDGGIREPEAAAMSHEDMRRELALLASEMMGAQSYAGQYGGAIHLTRLERNVLRDTTEAEDCPYMIIDPRPGLHIVDVNDLYATATLTSRSRIAGDKLFDVFPDNPDTPGASGIGNLYESIQRAAQSGEPHAMAIQRYDVRDAAGNFVRRHWRPVNTPVLDDDGRLLYILHSARELTDEELIGNAKTGSAIRAIV